MDDEIYQAIQNISGREAKNRLFHVTYQLKMIKENHDSHEDMVDKLSFLHDSILGAIKKENNNVQREYNAVHIVCGESAAGSLRVGLGLENKIIGFPDFFAVGPICDTFIKKMVVTLDMNG